VRTPCSSARSRSTALAALAGPALAFTLALTQLAACSGGSGVSPTIAHDAPPGAPAPAAPQAPAKPSADSLAPSIVRLSVPLEGWRDRRGAGVLLDTGEVLTAAHVVADNGVALKGLDRVGFRGWEPSQTWRPLAVGAAPARIDNELDIAYLKPTGTLPGRTPAKIAPDRPAPGTPVFALLPSARRSEGPSAMREGEVLGWSTDRRFFAVDISAVVGDSGAPVFDAGGNVVGVVVARSDEAELGFPFSLTKRDGEYAWKWNWPARRVYRGPFILCARP
jgi:S1-C subfamily serine protease